MGTHLKVLSESFPMNTNMTGFRWILKKSLLPCALDKSSISIGRVKVSFHKIFGVEYFFVFYFNMKYFSKFFHLWDFTRNIGLLLGALSFNALIWGGGGGSHVYLRLMCINCMKTSKL